MKRAKGRLDFHSEVLAYNVRWIRSGLRDLASEINRKGPSEALRDLVVSLDKNQPLRIPERILVSHLLLAIADGDDVRRALGIPAATRKRSDINDLIVRELHRRSEHQGITAAIDDVAKLVRRTPDAVRKVWERSDLLKREWLARDRAAQIESDLSKGT